MENRRYRLFTEHLFSPEHQLQEQFNNSLHIRHPKCC